MAEEMKNPAENAAGEENLSDVFRVRREKLAALTGQFAPEGPEAQGIISTKIRRRFDSL